jgi:hypothetical protein
MSSHRKILLKVHLVGARGEAEGVGQGRAVVAAELGDGLRALEADEDGDDCQGEDGGQGVAGAAALAGVGTEDSASTRDNRCMTLIPLLSDQTREAFTPSAAFGQPPTWTRP